MIRFDDSSLIINKDAYKDMSDKYASNGKKNIDENSKKQAMILENSTLIKNRVGLAAGFFIKFDKSIIIVLPGVPKEMKTMMLSLYFIGLQQINLYQNPNNKT